MLASVAHINTQQAIVTNARHYESLLRANHSLDEILMGIDNELTQELISLDLRTALSHLASITGAVDNDDDIGIHLWQVLYRKIIRIFTIKSKLCQTK
jgi:tRNA modification GTPase